MSKIKELREKQANILTLARQKLDEITNETPDARAKEIEAEHDKAMADYDKIGAQIAREEELAKREAEINKADPRRPTGENRQVEPGKDEKAKIEDVFKRAMQFGTEGLELEDRQALAALRTQISPEMRALSTSTTAGGYTIPQGFLAEITKSMAAWGPMLDPGVTRVIDTDTGNSLPWPTVDDKSNVGALLTENSQAAEQDVAFGQKQLDAYLYTSKIVRVSLQLLQDSAFDINSLLAELFGERIGRISNTHLTTGTGSSQPNGIVTASTQGKAAAGASAITADELIDLQHSVDPAYRSAPSCRWMFHDTTLQAIRKLKDGQNNYLWQMGDVKTAAPGTLLGNPYVINQAMPTIATTNRSVLFGDMNKYIVRRVRDFTLLRLVERYADYLQVGFVAFNRIDGELADTAAVKHLVQA